MHPILFRIPLPDRPLKLWWGLLAACAIAALYALWSMRKKEREEAITSLVIAVAAGAGAYYWRTVEFKAENVPIYSYGVMLGLSLVVGWYITLPLAEKDGLDRETMANCYVITALAALAGSRLLYIATNPSQFDSLSDWFALRRGGLVAYGGFLGGFLGSWIYLRFKGIRLLPWADVAVPSLAAGLMITRIGCYLFGCDFGTRLSPTAPGWLQKMGTFPHVPDGTLGYDEHGNPIIGSPAFAHHMKQCQDGFYKAADCIGLKDHSLPVHPTQIYESLVGLGLLALLLWHRKHQKFRGQIFFVFVFAYGFLRFLLELWRDDAERGNIPPQLDRYVLVSGCLFLFALAFTFGVSLGIKDARVRLAARIAAFVPPVIAFFALKTAQFESDPYMLSTSQFIGVVSALAVAFFYPRMWEEARKSPKTAMAVGLLSDTPEESKKKPKKVEEDDEDEEEDEAAPEKAVAPAKGKKKGLVAKKGKE
ncbi:MAG TPA: prolipoprotein diacylglyceryl transferase family protein, partial [Polyangiaceae bacterium]